MADGDEAAVARLKARGLLVNVVDRPELCDFTLPAIIDRDPVLIAIGTGGVSAGLAAALRQRLETLLPAGLGRVAEALFAARAAMRQRFPALDERRRAIGALLAPGGTLDPLVACDDPAAALMHPESVPDRLEQVVIVSGDPDYLTLRTARLLGQADRLYVSPNLPASIVDRARADADRLLGPPPAVPMPGLSLHLIWSPE